MKREQLKELGLTDEQIGSIMALHGQTVNELNSQLTSAQQETTQYQEQLTANQTELDALKEAAKGNEDLTNQLSELQTKFDDVKANSETTIAALKKDFAIELALTKAGARNVKAARALLDANKLEVTEDGIKGLDEQLSTIKKDNDYLFQPAEPEKPQIVTGGNPSSGQSTVITKDHFDKMTYQERADLAANNPEAFKQITEGGQ